MVTAASSSVARETLASGVLRQLAQRPAWLDAALDPQRVRSALERHVPEFASGALRLREVAQPRLFLKNTSAAWRGVYELAVEGLPGEARQVIPIRVRLFSPEHTPPEESAKQSAPFGSDEWQCYLPELRLRCETEPPEQALEILPQLVDPEESRALLERGIRAGSPAYRDLRIQACRPEVLNYKPGSRCTLRYTLGYAAPDAGRGWPTTAIAKVYRASKGAQAYAGMVDLWRSPLSRGDVVRIAEPLAYLPELRLLVQATLPEEQTLEQHLRATLRGGSAEEHARLEQLVRAAGAGLAALHRSGARAAETTTWHERSDTIPEAVERIAAVAPDLAAALEPLMERLRGLDAAHPAEPAVPSHGSFDSDQVLIGAGQVGFIDFDSFCMAEPAMDVSHFRAAIMDSGMKVVDQATLADPAACRAYLERLDRLGEIFLAEYASRAPVSRRRLELWESWDYLRDALHIWTKPKPEGAQAVIRILEYQLERMGWLS